MRSFGFVARISLFLIALFPVFAHSQFQEPTKDELQMTADPKAPGAPYIYLYREEITDQPAGTHYLYERVKILTEKGKDTATVRVPWAPSIEKLPEVEGRTIHADGTVIPLDVKPSDLVDVKTKGFQIDSVVFTLPSVEVGSILEYRIKEKFTVNLEDPTWMIQQSVYVRKAHYLFKTAFTSSMSFVASMGSDAKVVRDKSTGGYSLDLTDIPPLPDDDWMPPLNTVKWRVSFFYTNFSTRAAYWDAAGKEWANAMIRILQPTGTLKKAVAEIVAPGDTDTQKARKIYAAVMKIENTDYLPEKTKAERKKEKIKDIETVEDVWKQQHGSSDDLALLYVAMCRAAGLNVAPMKVVDRSRALFDESFMSSGQFDDYIAVAQLDGKDVFIDPGEKMCPFGTLYWKHALATGFRLTDKTATIGRTPAISFKASAVQRVADLTVDETGNLTGVLRIVLIGQEAIHWRQLTLQNDEDEIKKRFNEEIGALVPEGVQADFDHFLALNDYESNLMGIVKVSGTLGSTTGKRFFLPGLFFEAHARHPFVKDEDRKIPVDVHFAETEYDDVKFHLPAGYTMESGPQLTDIAWPTYAMLNIHTTPGNGTVEVVRSLAFGFTILGPKDYSDLHDFYRKVAAADQQQIVLDARHDCQGKLIAMEALLLRCPVPRSPLW